MSAEKIVRTLVLAASPVTALVSDRVFPGELPQGTLLPAIAISHISTTELTTIDANSSTMLVQSRIECVALAKDYSTVKDLIKKIRAACNYSHGTVAGFSVVSVIRDVIGPDVRDTDIQVYGQTIDFLVTWNEPNP